MTRKEYMERASEAYNHGRIDADTYDAMLMNADIFCDEEEYGLPRGYAEIEYDEFDSAEAIEGAKFDDMNFLRYMER